MCPGRSQPGTVLGEDMTVLSSFSPGDTVSWNVNLVSVVGWMDWDGREGKGSCIWDQLDGKWFT